MTGVKLCVLKEYCDEIRLRREEINRRKGGVVFNSSVNSNDNIILCSLICYRDFLDSWIEKMKY